MARDLPGKTAYSRVPLTVPRSGGEDMRFLVVDDETTSCIALCGLLSKHGDCTCAENGAQALEIVEEALAQDRPFDLICLDIMMPGKDGHEVLADLRRLEDEHEGAPAARSRVIMVTASCDPGDVLKGIEGWDAYLVKPVSADVLNSELIHLGLLEADH